MKEQQVIEKLLTAVRSQKCWKLNVRNSVVKQPMQVNINLVSH